METTMTVDDNDYDPEALLTFAAAAALRIRHHKSGGLNGTTLRQWFDDGYLKQATRPDGSLETANGTPAFRARDVLAAVGPRERGRLARAAAGADDDKPT